MKAAWAVALCGAAVAVLVHTLWVILEQAWRADERRYRDRPPACFRWCWPMVLMTTALADRLLSPAAATRIDARLKKAGLAHALTPPQFLAGQLVYAGLVACGAGWLVHALRPTLPLPWVPVLALGLVAGFVFPARWLHRQTLRRRLAILKALPFFIDLLTLSVEAGLNLAGAIHKAVEKTRQGPLTLEMNQVMREVRAGRPRVEALRELATRLDFEPVSSLVSALVQGELTGASLGPVLRAQSDQRRAERFLRAEKMAMEAPVRMIGPLVVFIFPCTFIVIGFPIVVRFLSSGF